MSVLRRSASPKALAGRLGRSGRGLYAGARSAPGRVRNAAIAHPRRTLQILGAAILLFALLSTMFAVLASRQASVEAARSTAKDAAEKNVATLLSYDHRSLPNDLPDRESLLAGPFKTEYASLVRDVVTPAAQRDQLQSQANVASVGVVDDADADEVRVLMFVNQTSVSTASPDPMLSGSRVRVTMQNENGVWRVSELKPV